MVTVTGALTGIHFIKTGKQAMNEVMEKIETDFRQVFGNNLHNRLSNELASGMLTVMLEVVRQHIMPIEVAASKVLEKDELIYKMKEEIKDLLNKSQEDPEELATRIQNSFVD